MDRAIPVIIISAETTAAYAVDGQILNKPGKLTHEEYEKVKAHSGIGANMLEKRGIIQMRRLCGLQGILPVAP